MKKMNFYFNVLSNRLMLTIAGLALLLSSVGAQSTLTPHPALTDVFAAPNVAGPTPTTVIAGAFNLVGHGGNFDPQLAAFTGNGNTAANYVTVAGSAAGSSAEGRLRVLQHASGAAGLNGQVAFNLNNVNLSLNGGASDVRVTIYQGTTSSNSAEPYGYPVATRTVSSFLGNYNTTNELVATGLCPGVYRAVVEAISFGNVISTFYFNFVTLNTSGIAFGGAGWNNPLLNVPGGLAGGIDNVPPVANVTTSITRQIGAGTSCDATASLTLALIENALPTDNITPQKGLYRYIDRTSFPCAGVYTVNYIVIDGDGNTTVVPITVTVEDRIAPILTDCPTAPVVAVLDPNCITHPGRAVTIRYTDNAGCGVGITATGIDGILVTSAPALPVVAAVNNSCGAITVTLAANAPAGIYPVVLTFRDAAGNVSTCSFSFQVPNPETLVCQANANVSLAGCEGILSPAQVASGFCGTNIIGGGILPVLIPGYALEIQRAGLWYNAGVIEGRITSGDFGKSLAYRVVGPTNTCWGNVKIEDKQVPLIACPANATLTCSQDPTDTRITGDIGGSRNQNGTVTNDGSFADCSKVDQSFTDVVRYSSDCAAYTGAPFPGQPANVIRIIERTWTVKDVWGNVSAPCTQFIYVTKDPFTYVGIDPVTRDCDVTDFSPAALNSWPFLFSDNQVVPVAGGDKLYIAADDGAKGATIRLGESPACGINLSGYTDQIIPMCGRGFKVVRTWTVIDMCRIPTQMTYTITQLLTFADATPPSVTATFDNHGLVDDVFCTNINGMRMDVTGKKVNRATVTAAFGGPNAPIVNLFPLGSSNTCNMATVTLVLRGSDPKCGTTVRYVSSDSRITLNTASVANGTVVTATGTFMRSNVAGDPAPTFTITAFDECGNATSQLFRVNITDNVAPNTVCKVNSTSTIGTDGAVRAYAASFDNGSTDACGIDRILVRRMTVAANNDCGVVNQVNNTDACFYEYVDFTCGDIGDGQIQVVLRAIDQAGNYSDCMVNITVIDKVGPTCVSAPDKKINCMDLPLPTNIDGSFDTPTAYDNCGFTVSTTPVTLTLNCGAGSVTKSWTFTDCGGNTTVCTQRITVVGMQGYSAVPLRDSTFSCSYTPNLAANEAQILASVQKMCGSSVQVTSSQVIYNGTLGEYCRKYVQTFRIIDMCNPAALLVNQQNLPVIRGTVTRQTAGPDGVLIFERTIIVNDGIAPIAFAIPNVDSCIYAGCNYNYTTTLRGNDACNAAIGGAPADILYYGYTVRNAAGAVVASATAVASASGVVLSLSNLTFGETYTVSYSVTDACLNTSVVRTYTIRGRDCKKPAIVCTNVNAEVMPNGPAGAGGSIAVPLSDLLSWATDNCSTPKVSLAKGDARGTVSADGQTITFTCEDTRLSTADAYGSNKVVPVRVVATDDAGNSDFCIAYVTLQNNMGACGSVVFIGGAARTENNAIVNNVTVSASAAGAVVATSDVSNGTFNIATVPAANVQVRAAKNNNDDAASGVTTFDIAKISQHVLDIEKFASPYQMIAADVDKSGEVDATDMLHMRRFILKITPSLPGGNFRFLDKAYTFRNALNPFGEDFPEVVNIASLTASTAANFVAVKLGDVNGSYNALAPRGSRTLSFLANDMNVVAGNEYTVNISADKLDAAAFQGTFSFNGATVKAVQAGNLNNMTEGNFGKFANAVTTSWNGKTQDAADVMAITFLATKSGKLSEMLTVNSALTQAMANDVAGNEMNVNLKFNTGKVAGGEFALYQNQPNPVANETVIGFNLPKDGQARLTITAVDGKVVKVINNAYKAGYNTVTVNKSDLNASGVFYYRLETADHSASKKMVIIE